MKLKKLLILLMAVIAFTACNDDDDEIKKSLLHISVKMPSSIKDKNARIVEANFVLKNVNTGEDILKTVNYFPVSYFEVEDGLYNITVSADVEYDSTNDEGKIIATNTVTVRAIQENFQVAGGNANLPLDFFVFNPSSSFVISEIFFSGSKTPEGKSYRYDKFFEIYNNTDKTLYADGLCIGEGEFRTTSAYNLLGPKEAKTTKTVLHAIYRIPGNGTQYPVEPGKTIVLADIGKDHRADNENSIDLSKADFEWYDNHKLDVDVPEVANLQKIVSYSPTVWTPHGRGYHAYVIFKLSESITPEKFATDNSFDYSYVLSTPSRDITLNRQAWAIDTKEVIDAVECSAPSKFVSLSFSPELDMNFTYVGETDDKKYGHSIKRKVAHTAEGGRLVLQDTNDSSTDFIRGAKKPSPGKVNDVITVSL